MGAVRWNWIHGGNTDLTWYIGSAVIGWLYVALVLSFGRGLENPIRDPFYVLHLGGTTVALTLVPSSSRVGRFSSMRPMFGQRWRARFSIPMIGALGVAS